MPSITFDLTKELPAELVRRLRSMPASAYQEALCREAADALEQQAREIATLKGVYDSACAAYGALRAELTRRAIPLPGEPDARGTGYAGEVGCG